MRRIHFLVEGQTEQGFVKQVLVPHFSSLGFVLDARCVETSRAEGKIFRGGLSNYEKLKKDLLRWMKEDGTAYFTTMVDFYRLPKNFPGYAAAQKFVEARQRVEWLEKAFAEDVGNPGFLPYIQLHEYEALLFCDPKKFESVFLDAEERKGIVELEQQAAKMEPEAINDDPETSPSKRILKALPGYGKVSDGVTVASAIGLAMLRKKCPHFNQWISALERLGERA